MPHFGAENMRRQSADLTDGEDEGQSEWQGNRGPCKDQQCCPPTFTDFFHCLLHCWVLPTHTILSFRQVQSGFLPSRLRVVSSNSQGAALRLKMCADWQDFDPPSGSDLQSDVLPRTTPQRCAQHTYRRDAVQPLAIVYWFDIRPEPRRV